MNSLVRKIMYGLGGAASQGGFMFLSAYYMVYSTNVFGISAAAVGTILLVGRFIDAFTDPLVGKIADKSRFKMGRYRFWIYLAAPIFGLSFFLMFSSPDINGGVKLAFAYGAYILNNVVGTFANIPFHSLNSVFSSDPAERTQYATFKQVVGTLGSLAISISVPLIVSNASSPEAGYRIVGAIIGVFVVICFWMAASAAKGLDGPATDTNTTTVRGVFREYKELLSNRAIVSLAISLATNLFAAGITGAVGTYIAIYIFGDFAKFSTIMMLQMLPMLLAASLLPVLVKLCGSKKKLFLYASILALIPPIIVIILGINPDKFGLYLLYIGTTGFVNGCQQVSWAMIPDAADYGNSGPGEAASLITFGNKLGTSLGGFAAGMLIASTGFDADIESTIKPFVKALPFIATVPLLFGHGATLLALKFYPNELE